ncbi:MAG: potassium transporter TrkG [Pseudomonadota bacterium]
MRYQTVAHILGWLLIVFAALALFPLLTAFSLDERMARNAFAMTIGIAVFCGGALILATRGAGTIDVRREGLLVVAAFWLLLPLLAAIPFVLSGNVRTLTAGYFEAVSGLTTTGATVFTEITLLPRSVVLWRGLLQWTGGLATLIAWAILVAPDVRSAPFDPSLAPVTLQKGKRQKGTRWLPRSVYAALLPLYGGLTAACFVGLAVAGLPAFDAICLAFATVSTGGFMPRDGALVSYGSEAALWIITVFMITGAISLIWLRGVFNRQMHVVRASPEPYWIITGLALLVGYLISVALISNMNGSVGSLIDALAVIVATAASHLTTTGFYVSDPIHTQLPLVLVMALGFVGAGRYSTSGGVKFQRVGVMLRAAYREFHHLVFPHAAVGGARSSVERTLATESAIWVNFFVVIAAVTTLALVMSTSGLNLTSSLLAAISAIGNVGPAYDLASSSDIAGRLGYDEMTSPAQFALAMGMVFGRFEVLALLTLFNAAYWRA